MSLLDEDDRILKDAYDSTVIGIILLFVFVCFLELFNMLQSGYV